MVSEIFTLKWDQGKLILIDQTLLPNEIAYRSYDTIEGVYEAIKTMVVRERRYRGCQRLCHGAGGI